MRRSKTPAVEEVSSVAERLAVLMSGGVAPRMAWRYLDESLSERSRAAHTVTTAAAADDPVYVLAESGSAWQALAAALTVSSRCGAPVATALHTLAATLRSIGQTQRDIAASLAGPNATARLVMLLPLVGIGFGMLLGFDTAQALTTPLGIGCGVGGVLLMAGGWRWSAALARRARPVDMAPGLEIDLMAIALSGGTSIDRARGIVSTACDELGLDVRGDSVDDVIALAERAGVPAVDLLRSEASRVRRDAASAAAQRAAKLSTQLMVPLGVCVLPAFMLLGVAPMMIGILSTTNLGI